MTVLPVYASESQAELTEAIITEEDTGSESVQESAASGEQQETDWEEQSSEQQDTVSEELSSEQQEEISEDLMIEQQVDSAEIAVAATVELTDDLPYVGEVLNGGYVGFKNKASNMYMTIPNGATAAGTNVCQQNEKQIANSQEFYLSYSHNIKIKTSHISRYIR